MICTNCMDKGHGVYSGGGRSGQVFGPACPMLESEAEDGNRTMGGTYSECRWTRVPEAVNYDEGSVECTGCLQDMALAGKAALLLKLACARLH